MNVMSKLPLPEQDQDIAFSFWVDGNNDAEHSVAAFAVEEAIFSLTRVEILLVSTLGRLDPEGMLGRKATLSVQNRQHAFPRYFSGIVVEATSSFEDAGVVVTRVLLLSQLYRLENGSRYRIFQGLSAPDIVQTIFCEHEIADAVWQLTGNYPARQFCMQYGESDFAFVQRVLAEEGIFYYFAHRNEGCHQLVLCDRMQLLLDCPGQARLDCSVHNSDKSSGICCSSLVRFHHMKRSGASAVEQADLGGRSNSPHLVSGHAVTLNHYPDDALNGKWYLASVRHEGFHLGNRFSAYESANCFLLNRQSRLDVLASSFLPPTLKSPGLLEKLAQYAFSSAYGGKDAGRMEPYDEAGYVCAFSALDSRKAHSTPQGAKPLVAGPHTARVIAVEAGDGQAARCKVCFTIGRDGYARTDHVTCWVPVASALGVSLLSALPEEGESVLVDFLGGNPDMPVITARGEGKAPMPAFNAPGGRDCRGNVEKQAATVALPLQAVAADAVKSAVYQKAMPVDGLAALKPAVSLAEMQAALSEPDKGLNADGQMREWTATSRLVDVGHHQRENIKGVYELNCGEKYLCKTTRLNVDASQKLTIRGPGGKVIIDKSCITFEAPTIRLRGRLVFEEEAFDRHEGIKSAIRDELPLVAECALNAQADNGKS